MTREVNGRKRVLKSIHADPMDNSNKDGFEDLQALDTESLKGRLGELRRYL